MTWDNNSCKIFLLKLKFINEGIGGNMRNKVIIEFLKKYWIRYVIGVIFLIISAFIQTLSPSIIGKIIDILDSKHIDQNQVIIYTLYLLAVAFFTFLSKFVYRYFILGNGRNLECFLRKKLFEHFQKMSVDFYNNRKTGDLMAYAVNDILAVRQTFGPGIVLIINGVGIGSISILSMVRLVNLKLTVFSLLPIPFIIFIMIKIGKMIQQRFRVVQENFASISDRVQENISGIRVIKSYVQEDEEVNNFEYINDKMRDSNIKMVRVSSLLTPITEVLFGISFVVNLIYGSNLVKSGVITLGDFVAFNGYLTMIMKPVISIGRVINILQRGMASLKRLRGIFDVEPYIQEDFNENFSEHIEGKVEIKNLTYSYKESPESVLKNISINISKGSVIGILGKTGSGKTTLMNLLLRLYNVENGKIFIDDRDINDYSIETLRENIGYVPQDNFLFSASIEENITFFKDIYSDEEIENATKMSLIYQTILDFPDGFETVLGERGVNLSGGQKQRISIARAIIKNPKILIMDDALSAVDTKTEERIIKNLKGIMKDRTGIIISNRISAIKNADSIIVLDKGEIKELGNHNALLKKGGIYFELYKEQFNKACIE